MGGGEGGREGGGGKARGWRGGWLAREGVEGGAVGRGWAEAVVRAAVVVVRCRRGSWAALRLRDGR